MAHPQLNGSRNYNEIVTSVSQSLLLRSWSITGAIYSFAFCLVVSHFHIPFCRCVLLITNYSSCPSSVHSTPIISACHAWPQTCSQSVNCLMEYVFALFTTLVKSRGQGRTIPTLRASLPRRPSSLSFPKKACPRHLFLVPSLGNLRSRIPLSNNARADRE